MEEIKRRDVLKVLTGALSLLMAGWCQKFLAMTPDGKATVFYDPTACSHCLTGSIMCAALSVVFKTEVPIRAGMLFPDKCIADTGLLVGESCGFLWRNSKILQASQPNLSPDRVTIGDHLGYLVSYNDEPGRTVEQIHDVLREGIRAAEIAPDTVIASIA